MTQGNPFWPTPKLPELQVRLQVQGVGVMLEIPGGFVRIEMNAFIVNAGVLSWA